MKDNNLQFGLRPSDLECIRKVIGDRPEVDKAILFGSRVIGNFKPGSDIDIALTGDNVNFDTISSIHYKLEEEGPLPYFFDIVDYTHLEKEDLKEHMNHFGKEIFTRKQAL